MTIEWSLKDKSSNKNFSLFLRLLVIRALGSSKIFCSNMIGLSERKVHEVEEERPNNNNEGFMLLTCILQQLVFPLWVYELFPKVQGWVGVEEGGGEGGSGLMGN